MKEAIIRVKSPGKSRRLRKQLRRHPLVLVVLLLLLCCLDVTVGSEPWGAINPPPPPPPRPEGPQPPWMTTATPNSEQRQQQDDDDNDNTKQPPVFQPQPEQRRPIHYNFEQTKPFRDDAEKKIQDDDDDDDKPPRRRPQQQQRNSSSLPRYASARNDPVTRVQSTFRGRLALSTTATALGAFVGTAAVGMPRTGAIFFGISAILARGKWGDLVRSMALAVWWTLQRFHRVRRQYPTWPHVQAIVGAKGRQHYPSFLASDAEASLWNYQPGDDEDDDDDDDFRMLYATAAMSLTGGICGGSFPLIPSWLGGLCGAGVGGLAVMQPNARGDLARIMAMRVVALTRSLIQLARELRLVPQFWAVAGAVLDRLMILDRQHRVRDRVVAAATIVYQQVMGIVQQQQQQQPERRGGRGPPPAGRRRPRRREDDRDFGRGQGRRKDVEREGDDDEYRRRRPPPRDDVEERRRQDSSGRRRPGFERRWEDRDDDQSVFDRRSKREEEVDEREDDRDFPPVDDRSSEEEWR